MYSSNKFVLGLIINPISGMGGSVGLKGTDGAEILQKALQLGAKPSANDRAKEVLKEIVAVRSKLRFITCPGFMGEMSLREMGFEYEVIRDPIFELVANQTNTTSDHTKIACEIMKKINDIKLILFCGGDGTARDICESIGQDKPCLGIPAGVKIYSGVFAVNPKSAGTLISQYLWDEIGLAELEVLDIDEDEFRNGRLISRIFGTLFTPFNPDFSQASKEGTPDSDLNNQERIAKRVIEAFESDIYYIIGPGTTIKAITDLLNQQKTVLGVDLLYNGKLIAQDLNEKQILEIIEGKKVKVIVSPIGKQGFLFGRGNLQLSPRVLRKIGTQNIIIISTKYKICTIPNRILRLDTRDSELDASMRGLYKIIVDYDEFIICKTE